MRHTSRFAIRTAVLSAASLVVLPLLVLWPFLEAGLVSDDIFFANLYRLGSLRETLLGAWPHSMGATSGWRPMVLISYAMNAAIGEGTPFVYRLSNVLLHGVCAALLGAIVSCMTSSRLGGVTAGALFAVHPIVHENVVWISGRTYPVAAAFGLMLCLWTLGARARHAAHQHTVGVALLICALASYEFSVVFPIAIGMLVLCHEQKWRDLRGVHDTLRFMAPYVVTLLAYLAFRWLWLTNVNGDIIVTVRASEWAPEVGPLYHRVARNTLFFVLKLLAWPWFDRGTDISVDLTAVVTAVVVGAALVYLVWHRTSRPLAAMWLGWSAAFFAPVVGYAGFADRFGYLSAAGLAALIGSATAAIDHDSNRRTLAIWLMAVTVMGAAWTLALRERGHDWLEAGLLAETVVTATLAVEPGPTSPVDLHFVGVPERHRSALVLITYFPQAVWSRYAQRARDNAAFFLSRDSAETVVRRVRTGPCTRDTRVYEWSHRTATMEPVWASPAGACRP